MLTIQRSEEKIVERFGIIHNGNYTIKGRKLKNLSFSFNTFDC